MCDETYRCDTCNAVLGYDDLVEPVWQCTMDCCGHPGAEQLSLPVYPHDLGDVHLVTIPPDPDVA